MGAGGDGGSAIGSAVAVVAVVAGASAIFFGEVR